MDLKRARAFVYHPDNPPKMIYLEEKESYLADGWYDSPAKCPGIVDRLGIDPDNAAEVQMVGETIQGVVDATNDALNLQLKSAKELKSYAALNLPHLKYQKNWSKARMLDAIKAEMDKPMPDPAADAITGANDDSVEDNTEGVPESDD